MVAGLFVASTPMPASADENERGGHKGLEALEAKVASLEQTVSALQSQVGSLQTSNAALQGQLAAVQSNHALLLGPFVSVDPNPEIGVIGPNIIFSGVNIHIVSGSGATDDNGNRTGLGNLIIGYDESKPPVPAFPPLGPGDRGGSHNLVIGRWNRFTQAAFGGFVAGEANFVTNEGACVSGGFTNTASGDLASVTGGQDNTASGFQASVTGGQANTASGNYASVSGGEGNTASGFLGSAVSGGQANTASGSYASVSGGAFNIASGLESASVLGGRGNTAGGMDTVVIGGQNVIDNNANSIAPQPPFP
jgi:hypothetical protein